MRTDSRESLSSKKPFWHGFELLGGFLHLFWWVFLVFEYVSQFKNPPFQVKNPHKSSCFLTVD